MKLENHDKHQEVMRDVLKYINTRQPDRFVLKGGAALTICHGFDRTSNDLDFDGRGGNIIPIIKEICKQRGYKCSVRKDTETTKRCMIDYGDARTPLKVEVSYRRQEIPPGATSKIGGITTYTLDELAEDKANTYVVRDRINDVYDLSTICSQHADKLSLRVLELARKAVMSRGLDHFEKIVKDQLHETTLDEGALLERFLEMYEKFELVQTEIEKKQIEKIKSEYVARKKCPKALLKSKKESARQVLDGGRVPNKRTRNTKGLPYLKRGIK